MLGIVTDRLRFMNAVDTEAADQLAPLYTVDVHVARSPEKRVLCCGIWVYRITVGGDSDLLSFDDIRIRAKLDELRQAGNVAEEQVEGPFLFRAPDERDDAPCFIETEREIRKILARYHYNCDLKLKAPKIRAYCVWEKRDVRRALQDGSFAARARRMSDALKEGFRWDPWNQAARRGEISALAAKRGGRV